MQYINYGIATFSTIFAIIISLNALSIKSGVARIFFTDEQKLKVKYFNMLVFSTIISFGVFFFSLAMIVRTSSNQELTNSAMVTALFNTIGIFILLLFSLSIIIKWVENFAIKHHIKFKTTLNNKEIYILKMLDKETCICSSNPNTLYDDSDDEYLLVPIQDIMGKHLIKEMILKPHRSNWSKFFDL
ncbi:hypothetical protein DFO70_1365 [Cytobacillus firmus]|uniref:Uncharacterized protein n=2 Tax=Cytobacillus TaxID=2675230 RepID=A0A366JG89_CYTFI|nr:MULTISPECIES: hypothetical protein [Cytobacillus]RBP85973.1 hypothetical protein DFO70_1365 [Cytobacillus firmus]TDX35077.1 hypothetical protein DFO72_1325 [Cytobacillus oceanisediminis]